jgi:ABC-2 type transport system permease protein
MKLWAIAYNTFREYIRDKILYNLLVFAVIMIGLSIVLGEMTTGQQERVTITVGLSSISIFGVLMSVFLGIGLVSKEIEKKTIYALIAKPVPRYQFILGRFLGLMITIGFNMIVMSIAFFAVLWYLYGGSKWPVTWPLLQAIIMIYFELGIITSVAMMFSSFSTPTLSAIFTLCFVVIGRLTEGILQFSEKSEASLYNTGGKILYAIVPNLNNYIQIDAALYGKGLEILLLLNIMLVGIATCSFFLIIAIMIFQRRDFI